MCSLVFAAAASANDGQWEGMLLLTATETVGSRGRASEKAHVVVTVDGERVSVSAGQECKGQGVGRRISGNVTQVTLSMQGCGERFDRTYSGALQVTDTVMSLGASATVTKDGFPLARYSLSSTLQRTR